MIRLAERSLEFLAGTPRPDKNQLRESLLGDRYATETDIAIEHNMNNAKWWRDVFTVKGVRIIASSVVEVSASFGSGKGYFNGSLTQSFDRRDSQDE